MYKAIIRPILFRFDPEKIHHFTFSLIRLLHRLGFGRLFRSIYKIEHPSLEREVFGITFPNPIGLAAGFDKDAGLYRELSDFGFGFIEIGTVTPRPQGGNEKKRLFRLPQDKALINRMGFNNGGVAQAAVRLKENPPVGEGNKTHIIIGGNIGKNKDTPNEEAVADYIHCFEELFDYVDYFVVNVSSPNTPGLRALQDKEPLTRLLDQLQHVNNEKQKRKPILLKIAPDITEEQLLDIIAIISATKLDGVIATNTTLSREGLISENRNETGGLSGQPLANRATEVIRFLADKSGNAFPIVGVGGIHTVEDAIEKIEAGATLVQLYTGFIYEGPGLVRDINKALRKE
jgi:dihydroorotate dehydrogenase